MSATTRGILTLLVALLFFSLTDVIAKTLSQRVGSGMALWARYLGQTVLVTLIILPKGVQVLKTRYPGLQALRSLLLLSATGFFFTALSKIGLAEATAVFDINPVLITLGSALFLGERFGPRRAVAVVISLMGALIIIRPGTAVFDPAALLAVGAALCYTGYALLTRRVGRDEDIWTSLFYAALLGAVVITPAVPLFWVPPGNAEILLMLAIGGTAALGHLLLIRALQLAEASLIAPFGYASLLFATLWGVIIFGERPDAWTFTGMVVIVAAGLYVWHRETFSPASRPSHAPPI